MPRRAKKKSKQKEATSQAVPPPESEEDRLVRLGMAMWFARDMKQETPTREEVEATLMNEGANAPPTALPPDFRRRFIELGKQDPRPFIERLKESSQKLLVLCHCQEEEKRVVERMQSTLSDLELVLAVKR